MAQSEMIGLFGGATPQQLRNNYRDSNMITPAQMSSQGLLQQVVSMGGNAGASLGNALGGLLGGKAPGEAKAEFINDAFKKVQQTGGDPAMQMMELSKQLQAAGYGAEAMQALDKANQLKNTGIAQRTAESQAQVAEGTVQTEIATSIANLDFKTASAAQIRASTESTLQATARNKTLLPYELETEQANLDKMAQDLSERKDLAPLEVQELKGRIAAAQSNLRIQQEQAPFALAKLKSEADALMNNETLQAELQKLPEGATSEQYMNVMKKYGDPDKVMTALNRIDAQNAANTAKVEAARIRADAKLSQMPKDVAEFVGNISLIDSGNQRIEGFIKEVEDGNVDFSIAGQLRAKYQGLRGTPDAQTLKAAQIQREFIQQANMILMAAKGVQTEGDAQRAFDSIKGNLEKFSNAGIKQALADLKDWQERIKIATEAKIKARGYGEYAQGVGNTKTVDLSPFDKKD
jgi:hypothetical protein